MGDIQDFEKENDPPPLTTPTEFPEQNRKGHVQYETVLYPPF